MRNAAHHSSRYVAAGVLAIAAAFAPKLAAQGGRTLNRPVEPALPASPERARLAPARSILRSLAGTWRFEIWFAGNLDGAPDASGTRVVRALFDDLRLEWTEEVDHSQIRGQGIIGFDPASERFFSTAVYNAGAAPELMTGMLDEGEPLITFRPLAASPGAGPQRLVQSSALTLLDQDHFTWVALDRGWRAVFTRQK